MTANLIIFALLCIVGLIRYASDMAAQEVEARKG